MIPFARFIFAALLALFPITVVGSNPGWTTYSQDGLIKAQGVSVLEGQRIIKTEIFDSNGKLAFIEYPVYGDDGKIIKQDRKLPDGTPWPYEFPVYGSTALGGVAQLAKDIDEIHRMTDMIDSKSPILEIVFLSNKKVEVMTGVIKGPLNGTGSYHSFKKVRGKWKNADEGVFHSWAS